MRLGTYPLIRLLTLVLAAPVTAIAEEHREHLSVDDLPPAVKTTVLKLANGHRVGEIEKEAERGKVVYKVKIGENEITLHVNGRVLNMKTERAEHEEKGEKERQEGKEEKEHDEKEHEKEEREREPKGR